MKDMARYAVVQTFSPQWKEPKVCAVTTEDQKDKLLMDTYDGLPNLPYVSMTYNSIGKAKTYSQCLHDYVNP